MQSEVSKLPQHHADLLDIFKEIKNSRDEEEYELFLDNEQRRDEFYERLALFSKTLSLALSSERFLLETPTHKIDLYRQDLKRFQNLKVAVKRRYQETIDYRDLEPKIQKLLDTHVSATEITQIAPPLNIFDQVAIQDVLDSSQSDASKADMIAHATKRTMTERLDEDPAFYKKFSKLIQEAIEDFRAARLSEIEYLQKIEKLLDAIVHRKADHHPDELRHNPDALALYGLIRPFIEQHTTSPKKIEQASAEAAIAICHLIQQQIIRDWTSNDDVQRRMMNQIDDYLYDVVRDEFEIQLTPAEMDDIIQQSLQIARHRMAA